MSAETPVGWLRRAFVAVGFGFLCAACSTPPPIPAKKPSLPWMLHRTFPDWDGKPVDVSGAPGPHAVAAFLALSMRRASVTRPDELGGEVRQVAELLWVILREWFWYVA